MTINIKDNWVASRRLCVLRLLVEVGATANESVIYSGIAAHGFARDARSVLREDLDMMAQAGLTNETWPAPTVRVVTITERGEDVAYGRVQVDGIEQSRWVRKT